MLEQELADCPIATIAPHDIAASTIRNLDVFIFSLPFNERRNFQQTCLHV